MKDMTVKEGTRIVYQILDERQRELAEPLTQERMDSVVAWLCCQELPLEGRRLKKE